MGISLLGLFLMVAGLLALIQTPQFKRRAGAWISATISRGEDLQVIIPRIEGFLPFDFRLPRVTVKDREGEWLALEEVLVQWSPADLFRGRILINEAIAARVQWLRVPRVSKAGQNKRAWELRLPSGLPPIFVKRLVIQKLLVGESVLGRRASFLVSGHMKTLKEGASVFGSLRLQRTDGPRGLVRISASLSGERPMLALAASMEEDKNGILMPLLSLPVTGPLVLTLKGAGPIESWKGRLRCSAKGLGTASAEIAFTDREEGLQIRGTGVLKLSAGLMGPKVSPFMKKTEAHFSVELAFENSGEIVFQKSYLRTDLAALSLRGRFAPAKGELEGGFHFQMPEIDTLSGLAGAEVHGGLEATGRILGPIQKPETVVSLTVESPRIGVFGASRASCDFQATVLGKGLRGFQGLALEGTGTINGMQSQAIQDLVQNSPIRWSLKGRWSRGGPLSVEAVQVSGGPVRLTLSGEADPETLTFKGRAFGDFQNLETLPLPKGEALSGKAAIWADFQGNVRGKALSASTRGHLWNLHGMHPLIADLGTDELRFEGDLDLQRFRDLSIPEMRILSKSAELSVKGTVDLERMDSKMQGHLNIPRLSRITLAPGVSLKGSLGADISVEGPLRAARAVMRANGSQVSFREMRFDRITGDLDMVGFPYRPRGKVHLRLYRKTGQAFYADALIAPEEGGMRISGLNLRSEEAKLSGDLLIHGSGPTVKGMVQAEANLADLAWVLGRGWGGASRLTARFSESGEGEVIDYTISGTGLQSPYGKANHLSLVGRLEDAFALGDVQTNIEIRGFQRNDLKIREIFLEGRGDRKRFAFSGRASGTRNLDFMIETGGTCGLTQNHLTIQVNRLKGRYGGHPVSLQDPLVIRRGPEGYSVEKAHFQVGQGQLQASFQFSKEAVLLDADFQALSLEILSLLGGPDLLGLATGRGSLKGIPTSLQGEFHVDLKEVTLKDPRFHRVPAAGISGEAEYAQDVLRAQLSIKGVSPTPIEAELEIPVKITLSPTLLAFPEKGKMQARLTGELDLHPVPSYLALEDQTLQGRLSADISAAGSPGDPQWSGSLVLSDGAYGNTRVGMILKNIQARARLAGDSLILEKASATDDAKGSLSLKGRVKLLPGEHFPFQLKSTLQDCVPIRTDDLTGKAAGALELSGSLQSALLTGDVVIGPAEVHIPERLPPEVPSMKVIEINVPEKSGPPPRESSWEFPAKVGLDAQMDLPGRVFVRGRGLDSEWGGKLHLSGNTMNPIIKGTISIVRGSFNFFGKTFSLTEGTIQFDGNTPPSPQMNITAVYTEADLTARILLTGTHVAPRISIESDPALPTDEILSRLFFRKGMSEISPLQALRIAAAANTLAGGEGGITDFMNKVRGFLGVDYIGLKESEEGTAGTAVSAGKYLSDKVYLEVEQGAETQSGKVSVEVKITPNISIQSETGADASAGVGINWEWQY